MEAHAQPLDRRFALAERGTSMRVELLGGLATFLTMSYILFVNPAILSAAGLPFEAVAVATAIVAAGAARVMGLPTNPPVGLWPRLCLQAGGGLALLLGPNPPRP